MPWRNATLLPTWMCCALFALLSTQGAAQWTVTDFGAVANGEGDCTKSFQQALDAAGAAGGGIVTVPAGRFRFEGTLRIPTAVTLQGVYRVPPSETQFAKQAYTGTILEAISGRGEPAGEPFIRLAGHMSVVAGLIIRYPEWSQTDVPPVPYPPAVLCADVLDAGVFDLLLINAYDGLRFERSHRFTVRNVFGYPSHCGLYVDQCGDIGRIENCHFWPFGVMYEPDDPYCKWVNVNGTAFEFNRTDWQSCTNTFCFGYGVGYKFGATQSGSCNGSFLGIGADSCRRSVLVDSAPGAADLLITNGQFVGRWSSRDSVGVEVTGKTTQRVGLVNCCMWGPLERCVVMDAPAARLTISATNFMSWDVNGALAPAVQIDAGKAILEGNTFSRAGLHVEVAERVRSAIIMGNQAEGGLYVINRAGDRTQLLANERDAIVWTPEGRAHYRIDVGAGCDARYLRGWHAQEPAGEWPDGGTKRWSMGTSAIRLPVVPGRDYTLTLDVHVPGFAAGEDNGLYIGDQRIASLSQAGLQVLQAEIPSVAQEQATLELRVHGWLPKEELPNNTDPRELGVAVRSMTMQAHGAPDKVFNACTGDWE